MPGYTKRVQRLRLAQRAMEPSKITYGPAAEFQFDYENARIVNDHYGGGLFDTAEVDRVAFRRSLANLIHVLRPPWRRVMPLGRIAVFEQLNPDEFQCFEIGALTMVPPDLECAKWWAEASNAVRMETEVVKDEAWLDAEYRTLLMERHRLDGSDFTPEWVSLENNNAGYDIGSWSIMGDGQAPRPKFIEVKHSVYLSRFFISRQEWDFALRHPESWELYFWLGDEDSPKILDVASMREDVAVNQGRGLWETMKIELESE